MSQLVKHWTNIIYINLLYCQTLSVYLNSFLITNTVYFLEVTCSSCLSYNLTCILHFSIVYVKKEVPVQQVTYTCIFCKLATHKSKYTSCYEILLTKIIAGDRISLYHFHEITKVIHKLIHLHVWFYLVYTRTYM
jgi:hypothetical protein